MQGAEDAKGDIVGLIVTARAQLYALEQAVALDDGELAGDFSRRLTETSHALRAAVLLQFPIRLAAEDYPGARECCTGALR